MDNTFIFHIDSTEFKYLRKQKSLNVFCEISVYLGSIGRAYDSKHSYMTFQSFLLPVQCLLVKSCVVTAAPKLCVSSWQELCSCSWEQNSPRYRQTTFWVAPVKHYKWSTDIGHKVYIGVENVQFIRQPMLQWMCWAGGKKEEESREWGSLGRWLGDTRGRLKTSKMKRL